MSAKDFLKEVGAVVSRDFLHDRSLLSFEEYLELFLQGPHAQVRNSAQYLHDVLDHFGTAPVEHHPAGPMRRFRLFDLTDGERMGRVAGQEEVQNALYRLLGNFVRAGAKLDPAAKALVGAINTELAGLYTKFSQNLLADENTWIELSEADLAGLPDGLKAAAASNAESRKLPGKFIVVNTRSSVDPFLTFSTRRDLREKVWKKFKSRGDNGDENDTKATIAGIVKLRAERARLLDFPNHAQWRMSDTMARELDKAKADPEGLHGRRIDLEAPDMRLVGLSMERLDAGQRTRRQRSTANRIFVIVDGSGETIVDGKRFAWTRGDTIAVPCWTWFEHHVMTDVQMFSMSDEPLMRFSQYYRCEVA